MASFKVPLKIDQGSDFSKLNAWKRGTLLYPLLSLTNCTAGACAPVYLIGYKAVGHSTALVGRSSELTMAPSGLSITAAQTEGSKWRN